MDFFKIIESLDEFLYEIVSWLLFYPITLWRVIRSPIQTMLSAETELGQSEPKQFDDTIAPPLFLLLTLALVHLVELGVYGESYLSIQNPEAGRLIGGDRNLTLFRIVMISILPLAAALRLARARRSRLNRQSLKAPFYAQCYAAALFTLLLTTAFAAAGRHLELSDPKFLSLTALALLWLFVIEGYWFAVQLHGSIARGFGQATILVGQWLILLMGTLYVIR